MQPQGHLSLRQIRLKPAEEWTQISIAWLFIRLQDGAAYWLDTGKRRVLAQGELLVSAPRAKGVIRASQLSEVLLEGFYFDPGLLCGFFTLAEREILEKGALSTENQFLPSTHPASISMGGLATSGPHENLAQHRAELLALALRILAELISVPATTQDREPAARDRFLQLISKMPDMELIEHSSEELARLCACTPRHFNRLFRAHFGESTRARQTALRLLKARNLLTSSEQKVSEIAAECGYRSLSLFSSLFKRRFGVSPIEWRQKNGSSAGNLAVLA